MHVCVYIYIYLFIYLHMYNRSFTMAGQRVHKAGGVVETFDCVDRAEAILTASVCHSHSRNLSEDLKLHNINIPRIPHIL